MILIIHSITYIMFTPPSKIFFLVFQIYSNLHSNHLFVLKWMENECPLPLPLNEFEIFYRNKVFYCWFVGSEDNAQMESINQDMSHTPDKQRYKQNHQNEV